jgi:hypothetical protein
MKTTAEVRIVPGKPGAETGKNVLFYEGSVRWHTRDNFGYTPSGGPWPCPG